MRRRLAGLAVLACITVSGCGPAHSRVHGIVRYQGRPLAHGTIVFMAVDNRAYPVKLGADGAYDLAKLPRGPIKVSVLAPVERRPALRPPPDGAADAKAQPPRKQAGKASAPDLPARYNDPERSGLSFDLASADREYSVDLE